MILTELPDLPPLPETRYNKAFREAFYKQWGKGNWIVCGWAHRAEYTRFRQTLSFKMVNDGTSAISSTAGGSPSPTTPTWC